MRINERIAIVASGRIGFGLTSSYDCNAYLVSDNEDSVLIDAGCGLATSEVITRIAAAGVEPERISRILITHSHADHAAGAASLSRLLDARVLAPAPSAAAMSSADIDSTGFRAARAAGIYPPEMEYPPIPVNGIVNDQDTIVVGDLVLHAIAGAGHSYDHTTFLLVDPEHGALLFSGDLILADGRVLLQVAEDCRLDHYAASVHRLAALGIRGLLPGHGGFSLSDGREVLDHAAAQFARRVPPPSLR